ncbi:MAG TPA: hemolysin family protein [Flavisolibacter sp.]|jgi:CBS domain containing-hemolysin-like protein|nr:hemolysin family protein [Flavisolibacter sp.]
MIPQSVLIWFGITILMMGFFAGIEMAYYSVNRFGVELKKKQGKPGALLLSKLIKTPEIFIGTTTLGFTISLICFVLVFSAVTTPLWNLLRIPVQYDAVRLALDIALAAFIVLVFGEFIPRSVFRAHSNLILSRFVWIVNVFYQLLQPLATLFINLSKWVLKYVFSVRMDESKEAFVRSDMETLFQEAGGDEFESGDMNTALFANALELPRTKIRQCLVPRKEIIAIESTASIETVRQKFVATNLSKLLVFEGNVDHIIGYVHQLDLFKNPADLRAILLPIPAVPESMSASDLINKFTKERKSIAWVVDEFGGTAGIVTMEDLLEEIFGEIHDEYDREEFVEKRLSENEYIFSGRLELDHLTKKYGLSFPDDEESETLSGYIINHHETIPQQKERIIIDDYEFDILNVGDTRIEMVKLKVLK